MLSPLCRIYESIMPFAQRPQIVFAPKSKIPRPILGTVEPLARRAGFILHSSIQAGQPQMNRHRRYSKQQFPIYPIGKRFFGDPAGKKDHYPFPVTGPIASFAACYYDVLNDSISIEEVNFYRNMMQDQETILLIGSGTGNLLLALARNRLIVHGIEPSRGMREVCISKALRNKQEVIVYSRPVDDIKLQAVYESIIVSNETFMYILDEKTASAALKSFWSHLAPGGRLVIDLLLPPAQGADQTGRNYNHSTAREFEGRQILCDMQFQWDAEGKWRKRRQEITVSQNGSVQSQVDHTKVRLYSVNELEALLKRAGFADITELRTVSLSNGETKMTFQAKKPADLFYVSQI